MKFTLIFVTLSTIALTKAFFPGPFRVCEDEVSGFECPVGQEPFPYVGEECARIRSGADLPRPRDLIGRNPCKGLSEVKKISVSARQEKPGNHQQIFYELFS